MFSFQLLNPLCHPSSTALLGVAGGTKPSGVGCAATPRLYGRLLVVVCGAWLATACTTENSPEQAPATTSASATTEEVPEESEIVDDGNDDCRKIQDMWDALPKLKTYKQFTLDETTCLTAQRAISYKFRVAGDDKALMTVALWDENQDGNENAFIKHAHEVQQATTNPNSGVRNSTLGVGEIPTVSGYMLSETDAGGKFVCLFKGHYYFEILVALSGKSLSKPEAVESYIQEYVKQIDPSKLK